MIALPYTWPAAIPFWIAFYWAFAAELPFARRDRVSQAARTDRGSMVAVLLAGFVGTFLSFLFAGAFPSFAVTVARVPLFVIGIGCIVAGGLLRRHCFRTLGASFTYDVRVRAEQPVVERGAYRFVRHPSYSAGLLLFGGIGLALTNWLSLIVSIVPPALAYGYRISVEERALVQTLGPAYERYMSRTKRLIPFVL